MLFRLPPAPQPPRLPKLTVGDIAYHRDEPVSGRIARDYHNGVASCLMLENGQWDYAGKWKRTQGECNWRPLPAAEAPAERQHRASLIFWWAGLVNNYNAAAESADQVSEYGFYLLCRDDARFKMQWAPHYELATLDSAQLDDTPPPAPGS